MRVQAIVAHPRPDSFCRALFERAVTTLRSSGHEPTVHDLYAEGFDPVLTAEESYTAGDSIEKTVSKSTDRTVRLHRVELMSTDGLLIAHPDWWGKPPAILAGWLDRVLVPGVAYRLESAEGEPDGLLSIDAALVLNTSDTPEERESKVLGDPLRLIWGQCVLPYCGVEGIERRMFGPVAASDVVQRRGWLDETESVTVDCFAAAGSRS